MSRRDVTGAVDFSVLDRTTGGDDGVAEEVLALFVEQAGLWAGMLDASGPAWKDACHTLRGAAGGIGAGALAETCAAAEASESVATPNALDRVRDELDRALADVAAWRHELMLRSLRG